MTKRIIDTDIDHYTAYVETHTMGLQCCVVDEEPMHMRLRDCARAVLNTLIEYQAAINDMTYEQDEVMGLDANGHVIQWDKAKYESYNNGETMDEFGFGDLKPQELARCYASFNVYTDEEMEEWFTSYVGCALWSSHNYDSDADSKSFDPDASESMDGDYDSDDLTPESAASCREDIVDFIHSCTSQGIDLAAIGGNPQWGAHEQHAHDLWLTRNGHGAGFWDRGYGEVGDKLSEIAKLMGSKDASPAGDGKVVIE